MSHYEREEFLSVLEERQKDLEQEIADIHDLIERLRGVPGARLPLRTCSNSSGVQHALAHPFRVRGQHEAATSPAAAEPAPSI